MKKYIEINQWDDIQVKTDLYSIDIYLEEITENNIMLLFIILMGFFEFDIFADNKLNELINKYK